MLSYSRSIPQGCFVALWNEYMYPVDQHLMNLTYR